MTNTIVLVEAEAKPAALDDVTALLNRALPETLKFPGCHSVEIYQDIQRPGTIVLYEHWDSAADHQKYLAWREETGAFTLLGDALTKPFSVRYFDRIDTVGDQDGSDR